MAKIQNPILFSQNFGISSTLLDADGLIDPFIDVDTPLFIDPVLLEKSTNQIIRDEAVHQFKTHFDGFIRLLSMSDKEGDAAWKGAYKQLDLDEPPENGLGYGGSGRSGSSRPEQVRLTMMRTSKEIIVLGAKDPEMVSLMGFFEENVGPDTISDFTTRAIINALAHITEDFCHKHRISTHKNDITEKYTLPKYSAGAGREIFLILVPRDIVRELPIANDWSDIENAAFANEQIRKRANGLLADIAKPTIADRKHALKTIALSSAADFKLFLAAVKEYANSYDPNIDALAYYKIKAILEKGIDGLKQEKDYDLNAGPESLLQVAHDSLAQFKHHVESGNLWEELWIGDKPKKERAAQLIYFAIADCFCRANNIDVSPEANMGGGPVDFKFSLGYNARVLIEMKRSGGTVQHGYERQMEIYKEASRTNYGIFVVLDYGDMGSKLTQIEAIRQKRLEAGEPASEIIVIDATKKASASKRV